MAQFIKVSLKVAALDAVRNNDPDTAIKKYQEYLALEPNQADDEAWAGLGGAYRRKEEIDLSLKSYKKAYEINPQSSYALGNIVSLLAARYTLADQEELKRLLPAAVRLTRERTDAPEADHWCWYDLATIQLIEGLIDDEGEGKSRKAIDTFFYAAERTPRNAKGHFRSVLGNLKFLSEHNPAIPQITKVIEMIGQRAE